MSIVNKKQKVILFVLLGCIIIVLLLLMGKFAYSFLGPNIDADLIQEGQLTASGDTLIFSKGNGVKLSPSTENFYPGSGNLEATSHPSAKLIASSKASNAEATYNVILSIDENTYIYSRTDQKPELILVIKDENDNEITQVEGLDSVTENGVSGFDITNKIGRFNVANNHPISTTSSTSGTEHVWTFSIYLINYETDQSVNEESSLSVDVIMEVGS